MIKYDLFSKLYQEAKHYDDVEMYIAERGWQAWMEKYTGEDNDASPVAEILTFIFDISKMELREQREKRNLSRNAFCNIYQIPSSTVQDWEYGKSEITKYMRMLIDYTFFIAEMGDKTSG